MDADKLLADLNRWAAEQRTSEAAAARARERSLRQQAVETATFSGLLLDLAERATVVTVRTTVGTLHTGRVVAVGQDFLALVADSALGTPATFVATAAVAAVRAADATVPPASGDRAPTDLDLGGVLAGAAADRPRVRIVVTGGDTVMGELRGAGLDVATVQADGAPPALVYVPLTSVVEVSLVDSAG